jgi:predicted RNase H-like nuclease (RuvC/YqgF family)
VRRRNEPIHRIVREYDRKFWPLSKEIVDLRRLVNEMRTQISALEQQLKEQAQPAPESPAQPDENAALEEKVSRLTVQLEAKEARWQELQRGTLYRILLKIQSIRIWLIPRGSARERWWNRIK